ncbi:MAG: hypothetical protein F7B11_04250 [Caldisphaeraceae archaeon]|nr:hypothetical protein [Caldisphaeraceae archaeon]MEB2793329.1 hypothetical protein [Caldisphaeraceae archaeon]MEB3692478.1 hypothetical protein [Caldisphaeraceae archaeon]MEB3798379.1 hypothetical protein [Caldisphaeraceae archaeon]
MKKHFTEIIIGISLLVLSLVFAYLGVKFSNLWLLIIGLSLSLAGAMIGIRGLLQLLSGVSR